VVATGTDTKHNFEIKQKQRVLPRYPCRLLLVVWTNLLQGRIQGRAITLSKTYVCNFTHHDFLQFGKQHSRQKTILSSNVLSQQCCEVHYTLSFLQ